MYRTTNGYDSQDFGYSPHKVKVNNELRLILFDLSVRGHHSNYIQHLIKHWKAQEISGHLYIVVSPKFLQEHSDVVTLASSSGIDNINFIAITAEEEATLASRKSGWRRAFRAFQEWQILCQYAATLEATHCLLMYFDTCELPLAVGAKSPCPFSGIYFRPTFHYDELSHYEPSWKDRLQQWREKLLLSRILRHPKLQTLFCLDPFAVKHLNKFHPNVSAVHLPDPVQLSNSSQFPSKITRASLGIEPDRQVFLLFGALTERKGIYQVLEAILNLPPDLCHKLCLLLVGESKIEAQIESKIATVCQTQPVQIIRRYEFIPEQEVQALFQLVDVVLAPYQKHVGMSGILLLAAAAEKPVLSSNYGLMGEMVRRYELGLTVDSTRPSEIAKGLTQFLQKDLEKVCDRSKMKSFAEQNSAEQFAKVIFENL